MRISEVFGLTKDRVDWLRRTVTVNRQLSDIDGDRPVFGPVKDRRNRPRTIPLPQIVLDELSAHLAKFGEGPDGLIFTGPHGRPLRRSTFSQSWAPAAAALGIPAGDGFHLLRHFYASVLIRAGESVKVVQERLGHTKAQMTLDTYSHLWPEDEESTRAAVTAALSPQIPHTTPETDAKCWKVTSTRRDRESPAQAAFPGITAGRAAGAQTRLARRSPTGRSAP